MEEKLRSGAVIFTLEQQAGWQQIVSQYAPQIKSTAGLVQKCEVLKNSIQQLVQKRATCGAGEYCKIEQVLGETLVRSLNSNQGLSVLRGLSKQELRSKLQELGVAHARIFSSDWGNLDWHFIVPEMSTAPA
jgi:hypothetical protein